MSTHHVNVSAEVYIDIADGTTAITRATENIDDFHDFFAPPITTAEGVLRYLAAAAVATGIDDASRLDGWGDLERGQVTMRIVDTFDAEVQA